jgi:hypothetical protein
MNFGAGSQSSGSGHALRLRSRPNIPQACGTGWQPVVNEKDPGGVSTIVRNQLPTHRLAYVDSLGDGSMRLPLRVPPDSLTDFYSSST